MAAAVFISPNYYKIIMLEDDVRPSSEENLDSLADVPSKDEAETALRLMKALYGREDLEEMAQGIYVPKPYIDKNKGDIPL